jgi:SAM-dependent methyltransferase
VSVSYYGDLLGASHRIEAFRNAIEATVRPGDRVLDIGTGLGTFAFFAARAGAGRVFAVDSGPVVHLAETLAMANGLSERVEFLHGDVPGLSIPESADLVIFEDFPTSLLDVPTYELLRRVHSDYLVPKGRMLPAAARLGLAPVQSLALSAEVFPLDADDSPHFDLDWTALRPFLANAPRSVRLGEGALRGDPVNGPRFPLSPLPTVSQLRVEGSWTAGESGWVHALAMWFDLEVPEGHWISNRPSEEAEPWGQLLLPLDAPLAVSSGETLEASVWREPNADGAPAWIAWECSCGSETRRGHEFASALIGPKEIVGPGSRGEPDR